MPTSTRLPILHSILFTLRKHIHYISHECLCWSLRQSVSFSGFIEDHSCSLFRNQSLYGTHVLVATEWSLGAVVGGGRERRSQCPAGVELGPADESCRGPISLPHNSWGEPWIGEGCEAQKVQLGFCLKLTHCYRKIWSGACCLGAVVLLAIFLFQKRTPN